LAALYDRVAADARAGRPIVAQVHVALCDNTIIRCGGRGLGDGDNLATNLYWATTGGMRGWFERRGSGWKRVVRKSGAEHLLETVVYTRSVEPAEPLRKRGVMKPVEIFVVADGWRGKDIDRALDAYAADLFGAGHRKIAIGDRTIDAGAAAHVVAYIGHNGWMDRDELVWPRSDEKAPVKGTMAVACLTRSYLKNRVTSPRRVPLLLTADLLFAGSHSFEHAFVAFAGGADFAAIRAAGIDGYAGGEDKPARRVASLFTNPSDRRW
jgi:hypothetical protein